MGGTGQILDNKRLRGIRDQYFIVENRVSSVFFHADSGYHSYFR